LGGIKLKIQGGDFSVTQLAEFQEEFRNLENTKTCKIKHLSGLETFSKKSLNSISEILMKAKIGTEITILSRNDNRSLK
jgi:hypothetical protein